MTQAAPEIEAIEYIKPKDLNPDPAQPRKYFDPEALQELADDIKVRGIMEPILYFIEETDGKEQWFILAGERRWRAAQLAGLKEVPCLYRNAPDPKARLLDQVSENFQRRDLNAIEMAIFFETMITNHGVQATKLPAELVKCGFKPFDRSYISNIRRLLQLPEWTQLMIQQGKLTAAHGKYLLPALASDKVMAHMQAFLEKQKKIISISELDEEIENAFHEHHLVIGPGKPKEGQVAPVRTAFDRAECKGCKTCKHIKINDFYERIYCLNEECYDEKQEAAEKKIAAAKKREAAASKKQKEKELAAEAKQLGVSVDELKKTNKVLRAPVDQKELALIENTQEYLDEWLRPQINACLLLSQTTRSQVVLWMASGAPGHYDCLLEDVYLNLDNDIEDKGIDITLKQAIDPAQLEVMACYEIVRCMDRDNLRRLAHHCNIQLEGFYTIDRDYLKLKNKEELVTTTPSAIIDSFGAIGWVNEIRNLPVEEIQNKLLEKAGIYGVPEDLAAMYRGDNN